MNSISFLALETSDAMCPEKLRLLLYLKPKA